VEDLKDIGVTRIGDCRKLLEAIAALRTAAPPSPVVEQPSVTGPAIRPSSEAERRQLTVMFCDVAGSTALSARLDPEDLRAVIGACHRCGAKLIGRGGGFVAKYMGDGCLPISAIRRPTNTTPSARCGAGLDVVAAVGRLTHPPSASFRFASASRPGSSW
jgi:class 3 adenylate cyclase